MLCSNTSKQFRTEHRILTDKWVSNNSTLLRWALELAPHKTRHSTLSSKIYCSLRWWSRTRQSPKLHCNSRTSSNFTTSKPPQLRFLKTSLIIMVPQLRICWTNSARAINHLFLFPTQKSLLTTARVNFLPPMAIVLCLFWTTYQQLEILCRASFFKINLPQPINYRATNSHSWKQERLLVLLLLRDTSRTIRRRGIRSSIRSSSPNPKATKMETLCNGVRTRLSQAAITIDKALILNTWLNQAKSQARKMAIRLISLQMESSLDRTITEARANTSVQVLISLHQKRGIIRASRGPRRKSISWKRKKLRRLGSKQWATLLCLLTFLAPRSLFLACPNFLWWDLQWPRFKQEIVW